ncbi:hypothetical protein [Streptomyces sp. B21-083]
MILPTVAQGAVTQARPVVVVAGQLGAGKAMLTDRVAAVLARRGGAV